MRRSALLRRGRVDRVPDPRSVRRGVPPRSTPGAVGRLIRPTHHRARCVSGTLATMGADHSDKSVRRISLAELKAAAEAVRHREPSLRAQLVKLGFAEAEVDALLNQRYGGSDCAVCQRSAKTGR